MTDRARELAAWLRGFSPGAPRIGERQFIIEAADFIEQSVARIEDIITAWAYAHDINGAVRNDLFSRLRTTPPEGDAVVAEQRRLEKYGDPHAGIIAAALQSRVSPQAGMREALVEARQFVAIHGPTAAFPDVLAKLDAALSATRDAK